MGAGSGVSAGYSYQYPKVPEPFATQLRCAQEKRNAFQTELQFPTETKAFAPYEIQYSESPRAPKYPLSGLNELKGLKNWSHNAVNHIFLGEVKIDGNRVSSHGFHYAQIRNNGNSIARRHLTRPNENGVYRGNVSIRGVKKNAFSTFFPREWSPQQTVNEINFAYANRQKVRNNIVGMSKSGIKIRFQLNKQNQIVSAYPEFEK